jgi:hypothetical protein
MGAMSSYAKCLAVLCMGVSGAIAWEIGRPIELEAALPSVPEKPQPAMEPKHEYTTPAFETYSAISQRPVFNEARRPPPPPAPIKPIAQPAPPKPVPPAPPNIVLMGIVVEPLQHLVVLRSANSPDAVVLKEGDDVDGWTVEGIRNDRIVLRNGDRREEIPFPRPSAASVAPSRPSPGTPGNVGIRAH